MSSVDGKEHVWIYARHPFLQIHIMADIAYAVLEYYDCTGDEEFMREKGFEMLAEIMRFWLSRAEFTNGRYEIKDVTGTDEHHLHVDNDAYTNYTVKTCFDRAIKIIGGYVSDKELAEFKNFAEKLYLPLCENGLIPRSTGISI